MIHFLSLKIWYVIYVVFILKFETSTSLHSVFIHNLYSVPTFLESGLYGKVNLSRFSSINVPLEMFLTALQLFLCLLYKNP